MKEERVQIDILKFCLDGAILVDSCLKILYANEAFSRMVQVPLKRIIGKKINEIIEVDDQLFIDSDLVARIEDPTSYQEREYSSKKVEKGKIQFSIQKINGEGNPKWLYFLRDVSLEEKLQVKYNSELSKKETLIDKLKGTLLETNFRYRVKEITSNCYNFIDIVKSLNTLVCEIFNCKESKAIIFEADFWQVLNGDKILNYDYFDAEKKASDIYAKDFGFRANVKLMDFLLKNKLLNAGDKNTYSIALKTQKDIHGHLIFSSPNLFTDDNEKINSLFQAFEEHITLILDNILLYERSIRDGLTNLYNVRHFKTLLFKELKRVVRSKGSCSLVMLDIDFFKKINDTYGHPVGDKVLVELSQLLLSSVRETDLVFRYGGEEFSIILPDTNLYGANVVAEKIRSIVEKNIFKDDKNTEVPVTISLGISCYPDNVDKPEDLVNTADKGLYNAKRSGRNQVAVFS